MPIFVLAAAMTAIYVKADTLRSRLVSIGIIIAGFFVLPPQAFVVAPVIVIVGLLLKEKIEDIRR